jgi:hypothetical protein
MNNHRLLVHGRYKTEKKRKTSLVANMVTGLNVNILTRSFSRPSLAYKRLWIMHKNNFQKSPQKYFENKK